MKALILCLLALPNNFAYADVEPDFKFDIERFEKSVQEDSDFTDFGDDSEFNFSNDDLSDDIQSDDFDDEVIEKDLSFAPATDTPKLDPNTQVISTKSGKYIYHPNQEKGLYKINRNSDYLYKYKKSPAKGFFNIKAGRVNLENFPKEDAVTKFETLYESTTITALFLEYDWEPFKKWRSLSVVAGGGISYARGRGQFVNNNAANGFPAQEGYTFMLWSASLGLTYKFKYKEDQLFLPFVNGALDYNLATEFRSGFEAFKYQGIPGAHFGGGVALNLGWLERASALELDKEFGINNAYLSFEARNIVAFGSDNDISGLIFLAGLSFEY
jgi:hypothetical protein